MLEYQVSVVSELGFKMFGKRKARLMDRMEMLVAAAQFVTHVALCEANGAYEATGEGEKNRLIAIGAAKANYLFARDPDDKHLADFNLNQLNEEAETWLSQNPTFQEQVVQSLRVQNTVMYGRTGTAPDPIIGAELLDKYGKLFPVAPNTKSYPTLIKRSLDKLSEHDKQELLDAFARRGITL